MADTPHMTGQEPDRTQPRAQAVARPKAQARPEAKSRPEKRPMSQTGASAGAQTRAQAVAQAVVPTLAPAEAPDPAQPQPQAEGPAPDPAPAQPQPQAEAPAQTSAQGPTQPKAPPEELSPVSPEAQPGQGGESMARRPPVVRLRLWLETGDGMFFGTGRGMLLDAVDRFGSLKKAAEHLGMSYRAAWGKIRKTEKVLGMQLIEQTGSRKGGHTLTLAGRLLMEKFGQWFEAVEVTAVEKARELFPWPCVSFQEDQATRSRADGSQGAGLAEDGPEEDREDSANSGSAANRKNAPV